MSPADPIAWQSWSTDAFLHAHGQRRPVLLTIVAFWSEACRAMDREVFADPRVAARVRERTIPIRVDADHRPDIADRYGAGGWPTTLLLTASGDPICGGTYVEPERLVATIDEVADRVQRDPDGIRALALEARRTRAAHTTQASSEPDGSPLEWIASCLLQEFDPAHGGFSRHARFPLVAPIAFALRYGRDVHDDGLIDVAVTTLDRMGWGGLSDDESGAFFRASARPDWSEPDRAHLLDVQADLFQLYLDAWTITGFDRYRDRALHVWSYLDRVLHDRAAGGFFSSEIDRDVDTRLLTDANAKIARALLHASHVLDDASYAECAARGIERLMPVVYGRAVGVAHLLDSRDGRARVRGLLSDQIHASAAVLDLGLAAGDRTYIDLADELMRSCLRKLWDADTGAFVDRLRSTAGAGDVGLLADPLHPFALNAEAARLLDRLGRATDHPELTARAASLRVWLDAAYRREGVMSADYGLALLDAAAHAAR